MTDWIVDPRPTDVSAPAEPWRTLHAYWLSKHVDGRPPARAELDPPVEIPRLVASLMILEVMADGYEYRLVGSEVVASARSDLTNKRAGSGPAFSAVSGEWLAALDFVRDNKSPRLLYSHVGTPPVATNTVLLLPLHAPPGENMKIIGAMFRQGAFDANLRIENLSAREVPA